MTRIGGIGAPGAGGWQLFTIHHGILETEGQLRTLPAAGARSRAGAVPS